MVKQTVDELRQMLERGDLLSSGQIAALTGWSRSTTWRRLQRGDVRWEESPGGLKAYRAEDVQRLLAEARKVHGGIFDT